MQVGTPFLTYYDDTAGERTELSSATFANWVAKTVNYLRDEHGVGPGSVVGLDLPDHWLAVVLAFGAWRCGATVVRGPGDVTFAAADLAEFREDVLIHPDSFAGGHDLPEGPGDPARRLVAGDVLEAALAAFRGGGSLVFGTIADPARVAEVERATPA